MSDEAISLRDRPPRLGLFPQQCRCGAVACAGPAPIHRHYEFSTRPAKYWHRSSRRDSHLLKRGGQLQHGRDVNAMVRFVLLIIAAYNNNWCNVFAVIKYVNMWSSYVMRET